MTTVTGEELLNQLCAEPQHKMRVSMPRHKDHEYNEGKTCVPDLSIIFWYVDER